MVDKPDDGMRACVGRSNAANWSTARKLAYMVSSEYSPLLGTQEANETDCISVGRLYSPVLHLKPNAEALTSLVSSDVQCCLCLHTELTGGTGQGKGTAQKVWSLEMRTQEAAAPSWGWALGIQLALYADKVPEGVAESMASIGLVGLYLTVVLQISKALKFNVYKAVHDIAYEDEQSLHLIYELCMDIYSLRKLAALDRTYFEDEERYFRELERYFRDTAKLLKRGQQLALQIREEERLERSRKRQREQPQPELEPESAPEPER